MNVTIESQNPGERVLLIEVQEERARRAIDEVNAHSFFKTVIFDTLSGRSQRGFQLLSGRRTDAAEFRHCPHDTQELPVLSL